jgi:hypothetical protein
MKISNKVYLRSGITLLWFVGAVVLFLGLIESENWMVQNGAWFFLVIGVVNVFETYMIYQRETNQNNKD